MIGRLVMAVAAEAAGGSTVGPYIGPIVSGLFALGVAIYVARDNRKMRREQREQDEERRQADAEREADPERARLEAQA